VVLVIFKLTQVKEITMKQISKYAFAVAASLAIATPASADLNIHDAAILQLKKDSEAMQVILLAC